MGSGYLRIPNSQTPKYNRFISQAEKIFNVTVCVIGRDPNILQLQQERVRGQHTTEKALEQLEKVWKYVSDADTHTVETHIYRLRKKIKSKFEDEDFIQKNKLGYLI